MVTFLQTPPLDVYAQMALDDILAQDLPGGACIARFFNWPEGYAAATFGYAQFAASARAQIKAAGIAAYTRRPTGGGIVLHKDDLTFSLVFSRPSALKTGDIYAVLHACAQKQFAVAGISLGSHGKESDYRPAPGGVSADCFTNPVKDDLLANGQKVLGGALRRYGDRVLYQGSLQLSAARANARCKEVLQAAMLNYFGVASAAAQSAPNALLNRAYELAKQYKTKDWIDKF